MDKCYVVFGNSSEWLDCSLGSSEKSGLILFNGTFPCKSGFLTKLSKLVFYKIKASFLKKMCFFFFASVIRKNRKKEVVIIIYDWHILGNDILFLRYIRKKYPTIRLVYLFTNVVKHSGANKNSFADKLLSYYDLVYAFDPIDSEKYGFHYTQLIYNAIDLSKGTIAPPVLDAFYVGKAKDRLETLYKIYDKLLLLGLNISFFICEVPEDYKKAETKINYNQYLNYKEIIERIKSSKCIIDVVQGDSCGLTIKVCEAVIFDKLLITTNKRIVDEPFYNKDYILVIDDKCVISDSFFKNSSRVKYSEKDKYYFSSMRFIEQLDNDLGSVQTVSQHIE